MGMKRKTIYFLIALLLGAITVCILIYNYRKATERKLELAILYKWQNIAFELCTNRSECMYFHGKDELELSTVAVDLYVYNHSQSAYKVTVEDAVDYFSEEYDSNGKLKVYQRPDNIEDYIHWYPGGEEEYIRGFGDHFNDYLMDHGYSHVYRNLSYEEVINALEEYENSSEYIPPAQGK